MSDAYSSYSGFSDMCLDLVGLTTTTVLLIKMLSFRSKGNVINSQDDAFKRVK